MLKTRSFLLLLFAWIVFHHLHSQTDQIVPHRLLKPCNGPHPFISNLNRNIDSVKHYSDSTVLFVTLPELCSHVPEFSIEKARNDTIWINAKETSENTAGCVCEFSYSLKMPLILARKSVVMLNNIELSKNKYRYNLGVPIVENLPFEDGKLKKRREIYFVSGLILLEVFFNKEGAVEEERIYHNYSAELTRIIDYKNNKTIYYPKP